MTKFSNKLKKPCFWPIFPNLGQKKKKCSQNIRLCHAQLHMSFQHHTKFQKKLMIQFHENAWTEGWTERRTDPILQDPSSYCWGSNNVDLLFSYGAVLIFVQLIGIKILMQVSLLYKDKISSNLAIQILLPWQE